MKQPILHIRRDAEIYDDEEERRARSASAESARHTPPPRPPGLRGLLRRRRTSLLPVVFLVLATIIILRILPRPGERADIGGWHAFLQARVFGEQLLVGVAFSRLPGVPGAEGLETPAIAAFVLPATGEKLVVTGMLSGSRAVLRGRMPRTASDRILEAEVQVGTESRKLVLTIPAP